VKPRGIYKGNDVLIKSVYNFVAEYNICSDVVAEHYSTSATEDSLTH